MEAKLRHLEMIQGVINRMAGNLFFLKGWTITLMAGLFALAAKDSNPKFILVALLPLLVFWVLDGYFLSQERQYRGLYKHVAGLAENQIDFSMDASGFLEDGRNMWLPSMFSPTLSLFYFPLLLAMAATAIVVN